MSGSPAIRVRAGATGTRIETLREGINPSPTTRASARCAYAQRSSYPLPRSYLFSGGSKTRAIVRAARAPGACSTSAAPRSGGNAALRAAAKHVPPLCGGGLGRGCSVLLPCSFFAGRANLLRAGRRGPNPAASTPGTIRVRLTHDVMPPLQGLHAGARVPGASPRAEICEPFGLWSSLRGIVWYPSPRPAPCGVSSAGPKDGRASGLKSMPAGRRRANRSQRFAAQRGGGCRGRTSSPCTAIPLWLRPETALGYSRATQEPVAIKALSDGQFIGLDHTAAPRHLHADARSVTSTPSLSRASRRQTPPPQRAPPCRRAASAQQTPTLR